MEVQNLLFEYIQYGGFPGLLDMPDIEHIKINYLQGIYDSIVIKDIIARYSIRDPDLLERITRFLTDNIGQIFSAKRVVGYLTSIGIKTTSDSVYNYIEALQNALVLYPVRRYDIKGKRQLARMEKYYIADLGLKTLVLGHKPEDIAQSLENLVYFELQRRFSTVHVGTTQNQEVDFIAERSTGNGIERLYVQVTYLLSDTTVIEREFGALEQIDDNYDKVVLSMDPLPQGQRNGIRWQHIIDFLLEQSA